jgi:uncharacterized protein
MLVATVRPMMEEVFFVAVHRDLALEDRAALDQAGIVVREGVQTAKGPWRGEFADMTPATKVLRVRASDEHDARLRVVAALGSDVRLDVHPIRARDDGPK